MRSNQRTEGRILPQLPSQSPQISVFPATLTQPLPIERRHLEALLLQVELSRVAPAPAPQERHDAVQCPCRPPSLAQDNTGVSGRLTRRGAGAETRRGGGARTQLEGRGLSPRSWRVIWAERGEIDSPWR